MLHSFPISFWLLDVTLFADQVIITDSEDTLQIGVVAVCSQNCVDMITLKYFI